jgi:hypothetical protein
LLIKSENLRANLHTAFTADTFIGIDTFKSVYFEASLCPFSIQVPSARESEIKIRFPGLKARVSIADCRFRISDLKGIEQGQEASPSILNFGVVKGILGLRNVSISNLKTEELLLADWSIHDLTPACRDEALEAKAGALKPLCT